ncbi:hypothetical protein [Gallaecimonas sp. GXIMD4217]
MGRFLLALGLWLLAAAAMIWWHPLLGIGLMLAGFLALAMGPRH